MRWFGSLCKWMLITFMTTSISAIISLYVLHMYMNELLKPLQTLWPTEPLTLSEFAVKLGRESGVLPLHGAAGTDRRETPRPPVQQSGTEPLQEDAVAAWSQQTGLAGNQAKEKVMVSLEEFQQRRESLSDEDKAAVFSILISQLPPEELQRISTKLEDGLTATELTEIGKLTEQYVKPEQRIQLMEIINK